MATIGEHFRHREFGEGAESVREKLVFKNIKFERDWGSSPAKFTSKDRTRSRKIMILDFGQAEPDPSKEYDVEVVRDTKPLDPTRGALIVRIKHETSGEIAEETATTPEVEEAESVPMAEKKEAPYIPLPIEQDKEAGAVYVLETEVPYNPDGGEQVPKPERFKHFTLDQRTLETLEKIATGVELREPVLLEGETSTSKTSSIEYLAMMTNNDVARFNLNGQTDTSELVGKFIPNDGQLQIAFEEMVRSFDNLSEDSQEIITRAKSESRGLTLIESQQIAQAENLKVPDWRWQDGIDVQAKKKGKWLILDEINLAEAQILERLNSQLEKYPNITLTENGGINIRELNDHEIELYKNGQLPGVEPLNPNFRIFATMNPAEYSGRQPMSPAYKDRWTSYKFVQPPAAKDYSAMMELMVYGEQPEVVVNGQKYTSPKVESVFPTLEKLPNFRTFVAKVAKFQEAAERLSKQREIGRNKKEPYIFTRRGLMEFLVYLEHKTIIDRKTKKRVTVADFPEEVVARAFQYYYLDKISNPDDLKKVKDQLDLMGISQSNWTHKFK
jgi:MoxR-like ATPase